LFPKLRAVVSKNEFDAMADDFERDERRKFGEDGFETDPESAEIVNENSISAQGYGEADLREMAKQIVSERVRIAQRLR